MKDNSKNIIIIPVDDLQETLQDFTDEEVGGIIRAIIGAREPNFEDRAMRIVYRQLCATNERFKEAHEAKRERFKKAAEARWKSNEEEQGEGQSTVENATNATHQDAMQRNAIPNLTKPNLTKKKECEEKKATDKSATTHTQNFSQKQEGEASEQDKQMQTPILSTDWRAYWNGHATDDIPHIGSMTAQRRERMKRLEAEHGAASIRAVIDYVTSCRRLSRKSGKSGFRATFDWVIGEAFHQLLEEAMQERRERQRQEQEAQEELRRTPPAPPPKSKRETFAEYIEAANKGEASPSIIAILRQAKTSGTLEKLKLVWDD